MENETAIADELILFIQRMLERGAPAHWDGKGFNKLDYGFAVSLRQQYLSKRFLSPKQVNAGIKMLRKYRQQLSALFEDLSLLDKTIEDKPRSRPVPRAYVDGSRIVLDFPYDPETVGKVRQLEDRRWDAERKVWTIPYVASAALQAASMLPHFEGLSDLAKTLDLLEFEVRSVRRTDQDQVEARIRATYPGLYEHQVVGIASILSQDHFILADDMGLGKTRQAVIAAIERGGRTLVICPASLKTNWEREIRAVDPQATVRIVNGSGPHLERTWNIINYDILKKWRQELKRLPFDTVIVDEAHYIKNDSQRSGQVIGYSSGRGKLRRYHDGLAERAKHVICMTGTPIMSRPRELFNLLRAIHHPLGSDFWRFAKRYCGARNNGWGWDFSGASHLDELAAKVAGNFLQRKKESCLDLPGKVRFYQPVDVSAGDLFRYRQLEQELKEENPLGTLQTLRVLTAKLAVPATIDRLESILESDEKALVFSCFTEPIDRIKARFGDSAVIIDGRVPVHKRQAIADRFNTDPRVRVLIGQIQAAGVGLNLTAASQVIINDMDWVPANHDQAEGRADRIGQTRKVTSCVMVPTGTLAGMLQLVNEHKWKIVGSVERAIAREIARNRSTAASEPYALPSETTVEAI